MTDTITIPLATVQQALVTLEDVNPSLVCEMAHHPKKDQHGIGQKCPLEIRHLETIAAIKEVLAQQPRPEQQQARVDVITVTLMREGINKHRARELADHFVNFTLPPPLLVQEPKKRCCDHDSDCAIHNGDALPVGPCDCSLAAPPLLVQEDSCFCHSGVSLQSVSGGAAPEGYLGKVTLLIDGEYVDYVKAQPPLPEQPEPLEYWNAVEGWVKIDEVREHFNAVNCGTIYKHGGEGRVPLYTAPPQREWVGLTVTTILNMMPSTIPADYDGELMEFARAVEAKLKEKNHG